MPDPWAEARGEVLRRFEEHARALLELRPSRRSVLLAVAQYWNDGADDEVHATIMCSTRETPVWPHECRSTYEEDGNVLHTPLFAGEECCQCQDREELGLSFHGAHGDPVVLAFEVFCREGSNQDMVESEAYAPYAIVRRVGDDAGEIELEIVGVPRRPANAVLGVHPDPGEPWADARSRALFEEICGAPGDDGPRVVLSDLLRVAHPDDPRGEAIALSLVGAPDAATRARRDALIAAHLVAWIHPLGAVIPPGCATFERGFLSRARVHARDAAARELVRGAAAWGTVEVLRFTPGSVDIIDPAMTALRDVGPIGEVGLEALRVATRPWAIERLHVEIDGGALRSVVDMLARMTSLPHLRELVLTVPDDAACDAAVRDLISRAPWSPQLAQLTLVVPTLEPLARWSALRPAHAWLAVVLADDDRQPSGWQLGFGLGDAVEITQVGWHARATMPNLVALIHQLPPSTAIRLRSTRHRRCIPDDVRYLREHTSRDVAVAWHTQTRAP